MTNKKIVILGFLIATGIILQLMESLLPFFIVVPGFKIGLANIIVLVALELYGPKEMMIVGLTRVLLASLLQGTIFSISFWLSLSGAIISMLFMIFGKRVKVFSLFGISILGAIGHHIGQVCTITFLYQQYYMQVYLPLLLALSIPSGLLIASIAQVVIERMKSRKEGWHG